MIPHICRRLRPIGRLHGERTDGQISRLESTSRHNCWTLFDSVVVIIGLTDRFSPSSFQEFQVLPEGLEQNR